MTLKEQRLRTAGAPYTPESIQDIYNTDAAWLSRPETKPEPAPKRRRYFFTDHYTNFIITTGGYF